jgi:hypothetical protein
LNFSDFHADEATREKFEKHFGNINFRVCSKNIRLRNNISELFSGGVGEENVEF